ncbi:MAG: M42 family peptidase, partial [Clostridia bacterium]|nr:M42 family peptidase [Clostridia bacterium]
MKKTLIAVLEPFGTSGNEMPVADALSELIRPYVDEVRVDAIGNVIAFKRGAGKRIMLSAHMDTIGYIVLDADKNGYLRISNIGGIRPDIAGMRHIAFANGVQGVLCIEPIADKGKAELTKLYVDIGADSQEAALSRVPVGTMGSLRLQVTEMGDDLLAAPYMDDRAACAVQVELLKALTG